MIQEALGKLEGVIVNGININNIRYAYDAVLIADSLKELQKMLDYVNEACKAYAMEINDKKTKVMVISQKAVLLILGLGLGLKTDFEVLGLGLGLATFGLGLGLSLATSGLGLGLARPRPRPRPTCKIMIVIISS